MNSGRAGQSQAGAGTYFTEPQSDSISSPSRLLLVSLLQDSLALLFHLVSRLVSARAGRLGESAQLRVSFMGWLRSLMAPIKKLWIRVHSAQKKKRGIYILYEDVKSCPCEDVQILWSILVESHPPPPLRLKQ
ncbi:hypothetical protein VPH35_028205 [Triticum aestivum]|nr:uncharacterized protein LOC123041095 [Triticum aestivum]